LPRGDGRRLSARHSVHDSASSRAQLPDRPLPVAVLLAKCSQRSNENPSQYIYNALYHVSMNETAASTIRGARARSGLTQVQLAVKANVAQSVVSAYESARREPSLETLRKLVSAAGFDLNVVLVPSPSPSPSPRRGSVEINRSPLLRTLGTLGATDVRLFGSVARGDDGPDSDIDLLVDIAPDIGLFALGRMRSEAERILGSSVDIVPANSLKPDVAERALAEAISL